MQYLIISLVFIIFNSISITIGMLMYRYAIIRKVNKSKFKSFIIKDYITGKEYEIYERTGITQDDIDKLLWE